MDQGCKEELARAYLRARELHEESWLDKGSTGKSRFGNYSKSWNQCCREATDDDDLVALIGVMVVRFVDYYDWSMRILNRKAE